MSSELVVEYDPLHEEEDVCQEHPALEVHEYCPKPTQDAVCDSTGMMAPKRAREIINRYIWWEVFVGECWQG